MRTHPSLTLHPGWVCGREFWIIIITNKTIGILITCVGNSLKVLPPKSITKLLVLDK